MLLKGQGARSVVHVRVRAAAASIARSLPCTHLWHSPHFVPTVPLFSWARQTTGGQWASQLLALPHAEMSTPPSYAPPSIAREALKRGETQAQPLSLPRLALPQTLPPPLTRWWSAHAATGSRDVQPWCYWRYWRCSHGGARAPSMACLSSGTNRLAGVEDGWDCVWRSSPRLSSTPTHTFSAGCCRVPHQAAARTLSQVNLYNVYTQKQLSTTVMCGWYVVLTADPASRVRRPALVLLALWEGGPGLGPPIEYAQPHGARRHAS